MRASWNPLKTVAQSTQHGWTIDLDPTKPNQPLTISCSEFSWLALTIKPLPQHSLIPEEVYVRQQDLIARFGQTAGDTYAFQVDYRLLEAPAGFDLAIEVWLSVQTSLLDCAPKLLLSSNGDRSWQSWTHSQLASLGDSEQIDCGSPSSPNTSRAACALNRPNFGCLWLVEPRDQCQLNWIGSVAEPIQQAEIFGSFLEKGVIRRARMQLLTARHAIATDDVRAAYEFLQKRELPLTA